MKFVEMQAPFPGMRMWGSKSDSLTFVIVYEPDDGPGHGYTASWKNIFIKSTSNYIGSNYETFAEAKKACEDKAKELKQ